jgi:hypothetical protein
MDKTIYDLELHETLIIDDECLVRRVVGGWIYESLHTDINNNYYMTSVFVPAKNCVMPDFMVEFTCDSCGCHHQPAPRGSRTGTQGRGSAALAPNDAAKRSALALSEASF